MCRKDILIRQYNLMQLLNVGKIGLMAVFSLVLTACALRGGSIPDTSILTDIQESLDQAAISTVDEEEVTFQEGLGLLDELIPALSLDENLLAPVEERMDITAPGLSADDFFNSLVTGTNYGVVLSPDVDVRINLSLPNVTIEETMDTLAEI